VQHEHEKAMNVTLKLPDETVREARHLAIDENTSLSALVAQLLEERLKQRFAKPRQTLAEAMRLPDAPEWFYEKEFPLPDRSEAQHRTFSFEADGK
jgi:N-acetylglutamate synthase-like GNAT family acetyltransferase